MLEISSPNLKLLTKVKRCLKNILKKESQSEESDSSPKTNMVGNKTVDLDDRQKTELEFANVQSCARN